MWDEKYSKQHYIYGTEPNGFLKNNYQTIPQGPVLCLAEGEGRNAVFLAQKGYNVVAIDSSIVGLKKAEKLAKSKQVEIELIHGDLETFDLGRDQWHGIVSIFCHVPQSIRTLLHESIQKALKVNGVFLLEAYTPEQLSLKTGGPPTKELMMSKELLTKELKGMTFEHLSELERSVIEGTHHFGTGAVVQALAHRAS